MADVMTNYAVDPLIACCPRCGAFPGEPCLTASGLRARPHKPRASLALETAALADPALDPWFEGTHPDWRRTAVIAIAGRIAGWPDSPTAEDPETAAADYGFPAEMAGVVAAWAQRWPGAWR